MKHKAKISAAAFLSAALCAAALLAGMEGAKGAAGKVAGQSVKAAGAGCTDLDGDGYGPGCPAGEDCNNLDPGRSPGAEEACDFIDNDCDGFVDEVCPVESRNMKERVFVKAGPFIMGSGDGKGSSDERPRHKVRLDGFRMDMFEVTVGRYRECVMAGACTPPGSESSALRKSYYTGSDFENYPVIHVEWLQAKAFCEWAGGRLPTEAEWEKAARGPAPDTRTYPWGEEKPDCARANFGGRARGCLGDTDLAGRRKEGRSPFGLLDMSGNVWEWVSDWYDSRYYASSPLEDPPGPEWGSYKVIRGGCYEEGPESIRVSCRGSALPTTEAANIGFRCAWDEE